MARTNRFCPARLPQHVIQRGNNKRECFVDELDFINYAAWVRQYSVEFEVQIHAWVFMSNHVHLLLTPQTDSGIAAFMQSLGRRYVLYFNKRHHQTGTLWEGRYKSSAVETSRYLLTCYRYIELNPVRSGMVKTPQDYRWSSYHSNADGKPSNIISAHSEYLALGSNALDRQRNYKKYVDEASRVTTDEQITLAVNKGLVTGSDTFAHQLELTHGVRFNSGKRGRPYKRDV